MPVYLQIFLLVVGFILFIFLAMLAGGWGLRRVCFRIIADLEEAGAMKASRAVRLQDERRNFFRVGTGNLRPRAVELLLKDGLIVKTGDNKYYLDREKLAEMRSKIKR